MNKIAEHQQEKKKALAALTALRQLRNLEVLTPDEHKTIYVRMQRKFGDILSVIR